MIKAIIFDMDDTLYKEYDFVFGGFRAVAKYLGDKYKLDEDNVYEKIIEIFNKDGRGKIFNSICDYYNINENVANLVDIYRFHEPNINLYDDAEEILQWCKENQIKTGIITDGMSKVQWNKIRALGLEEKVDKIIVSDDFGREFWKPHTRTYEEMMKHFALKGEECVYVGDNPNKDFIGCKQLCMKTVRIIRMFGDYINLECDPQYEADYIIKKIVEIRNINK